MKSTSEVGHAKNIANLNVLNTYIQALGTIYNPTNPHLLLTNLQNKYATVSQDQQSVNELLAPYSLAVDDREILFQPLSKELTKLRKAYKATESVTPKQMEDFMNISRKLRGVKKYTPITGTTSEEEGFHHSVYQTSYDQRTNNMDLLISLLQNTTGYNPNEAEYKIAVLQTKKADMVLKNQAVTNTYVPLNNARSTRNHNMYKAEDNLVDVANKAKDYLATILDTSSTQYKAIARLQFKKN